MTSNTLSSTTDQIVVGVDGSDSSNQALRWASFLAQSTNATLHAIAVWQPFGTYGLAGAGWTGVPTVPTDFDPEGDAEKILTGAVDRVFGAHRPAALELSVRSGLVAKVLLDASVGARMLVLGSRGHGGFAGLLLGSVSTACAEHAKCPVLVVHGTTAPPVLPPVVEASGVR